ncbi:AAA family ATPase [Chloroflexi bacterium TSY]|nr:AAA family ATPase [Chloroflexi bacterium TSY]
MTTAIDNSYVVNPYVGPRSFTESESDLFFGRKHETDDLLSLILIDRLVLFYAPSGAGKSSLVNASLQPSLRQEGFEVLPIGRVSGEWPNEIAEVNNIFTFNLILSLDQGQWDVTHSASYTLTDYLSHRERYEPVYREKTEYSQETEAKPHVLIIDQFEEIFTSNSEHWGKREDFFMQLSQAIHQDELLWVVLVLRAEYVAELDPYARLLPGRLRTRFYMQSLDFEDAIVAITAPAQIGLRPFEQGVAEHLADNLRLIQTRDHGTKIYKGEFIEPLQLQVVCHRLWDILSRQQPATICETDLMSEAETEDLTQFVNATLARFYDQIIFTTAHITSVPEVELRKWCEEQLITEAGTRNLVFRGPTQTGGVPNEAIDILTDRLLIHAVRRFAATFYELIHDRFINPILESNQEWYQRHPLLELARAWEESGKNANKLLEGQLLTEARQAGNQDLGSLVVEYLNASQKADAVKREAERKREAEQTQALAEEQRKLAREIQERREEQQKANRWLLWLTAIFISVSAIVICAYWVFS